MPFTKEQLNQAQLDVVRETSWKRLSAPDVFLWSGSDGYFRENVVDPCNVAAWPLGRLSGAGRWKGIRVKTSSFSRHHVNGHV